MGFVETEQMVRVIEATSNAISNTTSEPKTAWWQIFAIVAGAMAALITAAAGIMRVRKK